MAGSPLDLVIDLVALRDTSDRLGTVRASPERFGTEFRDLQDKKAAGEQIPAPAAKILERVKPAYATLPFRTTFNFFVRFWRCS